MVTKKNINVGTLFKRLSLATLAIVIIWIIYSLYQNDGKFVNPRVKGQKVNVTVFYEVLCPDSKSFILHELYPTWEKVPEIMDIHYRPFGKAHINKNGDDYQFSCQHGPTECLGNIVHSCAIKYVPQPLPYIKCMMENNYEPMKIGKQCANLLDIDWAVIEDCANGKEGRALHAEAGYQTLSDNKRGLYFVPTIALNGAYDNQNLILKNLLAAVCNVYDVTKTYEKCIQVV